MQIYCHTNLDLFNEVWPTDLPCLPAVGHEIMSLTVHKEEFQLCLQVCAIRWEYFKQIRTYVPKIELHMTEYQKRIPPKESKTAEPGSITAFYEWYAPLVGRSVGSFI